MYAYNNSLNYRMDDVNGKMIMTVKTNITNDPTLLLQECRQIMTRRMRSSITQMLNEVDENLLGMAQEKSGSTKESDCFDAVREIRLRRIEIKTRFERRFINLFNNEVQQLTYRGRSRSPGSDRLTESSSETRPEPEDVLPLDNSLGVVQRSCGALLLELDRKVAILLDRPSRKHPMHPSFVFEAFRDACWDIKAGIEVREMMFRTFEKHVSIELQGIYEDINRLLDTEADPGNETGNANVTTGIMHRQESDPDRVRREVKNRIEERLEKCDIPVFVQEFLRTHWRVFLEDVFSRYTENSIAWNAAQQTMDDLIWLTGKSVGLYDRRRQVQLLPSLLFRLVNGMKVSAMEDEEMDAFLGRLREHQLRNLKEGEILRLDAITEEAVVNSARKDRDRDGY